MAEETEKPTQWETGDPAEAQPEEETAAYEAGGEAEEFAAEDAEAVEAAAEPDAAAAETPAEEDEPLLQTCPNCAALLDVSDEEPFAQVHCPLCGTAMRARTQLKNFSLVETLGSGGMGAVYKARDTNLNRVVALKVVRKEYSSDPEYLAKFEREARITAAVNHPHVVKVFSFGSDHGLFYIAMELVDKGSLDDLMALQGRVAESQAVEVGIQIAQGLQAAHEVGLIHRDVKPGNILFAEARTAKIVDFGLALLAEHEAEERGEVWGTPYYVAPEKLDHQPEDFRSDIYSLGGTLFHAIAGRPPYEAESASVVALKHLKSQPVSLQAFAPDVSSATAYVINRMLHKNPDERYQSYKDLIEHLQYAKAQLLEASHKPRAPKQRVVVQSKEQQSIVGWISFALLVILLGLGIAGYVFRDRLFTKETPAVDLDAAAARQAAAAAEEKYQAARRQMLDSGDFAAAQDAFHQLGAQEPHPPQPLLDWITLHEGFSALLAGHGADAREAFKALRARGMFATDPANKTLANFFVETARLAEDEKPLPATVVKNYSETNVEALALFIFALKDWELGQFDDANQILAAFLASTPEPPYGWISDYKPFAQKYADEFAAYQKLNTEAAGANTAEQRAAVIEQLKALSASAHGRMVARLGEMQQELEQKTAAEAESHAQQQAAERDAEEKSLAAARAKFAQLCAEYKFADARAAVQSVKATDETVTRERDKLLKKAAWLQQFKTILINDLNAAGYPETFRKKNGMAVTGGIKKATEAEMSVQTPYGFIPVQWADVPAATLLAMADYFAKSAATPALAADRAWLSGVFACELGMEKEGRDHLTLAAQEKPEYRDELGMFFDTAGAG